MLRRGSETHTSDAQPGLYGRPREESNPQTFRSVAGRSIQLSYADSALPRGLEPRMTGLEDRLPYPVGVGSLETRAGVEPAFTELQSVSFTGTSRRGVPTRIRTEISGVRVRRPEPLADRDLERRMGLEPTLPEWKPGVLPLRRPPQN